MISLMDMIRMTCKGYLPLKNTKTFVIAKTKNAGCSVWETPYQLAFYSTEQIRINAVLSTPVFILKNGYPLESSDR